ncbi:MAG: hypothetical protein KDA47_20905 [Planctomycetales bacterium]|nr:hypothetical protein [Planctomycetales bacterium]
MNDTDQQALLQKFEPRETGVITADPQVTEARFSPCGCYLAAGGFDARVRVWDISGDEPTESPAIVGHNGWVHAIVFHPEQDVIYSADSWGQIRATRHDGGEPESLWNVEQAHDGWIRQLDISPDGKLLASAAPDGRVCVWSTADGQRVAEWTGHNEDVQSLRFDPSGKLLASGDAKGKVRLWQVDSGECIREFDAGSLWLLHRLQDVGGVRLIRFNHDGSLLACGGVTPKNGGTVQGKPTLLIFDTASGEQRQSIEFGEDKDCLLHDLVWHADDVLIGVTSGTPGTGKLVMRRPGDEKPFFETTKMANCHSLSYHADTNRLAIVATNKGSNGNGRRLNKDGEYEGNNSPIHLLKMGSDTDSAKTETAT